MARKASRKAPKNKKTKNKTSPLKRCLDWFRGGGVRALLRRYPTPFIVGGTALLLGLMILVLYLCLRGPAPLPPLDSDTESTDAPAPETDTAPTVEPVPQTALFPNPLTGLEMGDDALTRLRPIAVMHNNSRAAMPLIGISRADMIYEMQVEGGITRLMGLYQNIAAVPVVGALRSARTGYLEATLSHDAVLAHVGASRFARAEIKEWGVGDMDAMSSSDYYFWRDSGRRANGYSLEHTMMANGSRLRELLDKMSRTQREEGHNQTFALEVDLPDGKPAADITAHLSTVKTTGFAYTEKTNRYTASQFGGVMTDGGQGGGSVEVSNVLILKTSITSMGTKEGHVAIDLRSGGSGWYATGGKAIPIRWARNGLKAPFAYTRQDGTPLTFAVGRTFVCIVPNNLEPTIQ